MDEFSHLTKNGKFNMVNISKKDITKRTAVALSRIQISAKLREAIEKDNIPKGNIFSIATVSGIMAAKRASELIPLTHIIPLSKVSIDIFLEETGVIEILCMAIAEAKTGVEMESLTGAAIAALTIYDMCKSIDRHIVINDIMLLYKTGGKNGEIKSSNYRKYEKRISALINS